MSAAAIPARFGSGQAVKRIEDASLLKGEGRFTDDFNQPGQTYLAFLRSPYAHAHITALDMTAAREMPGVVAVYSGEDLVNAGVKPMPNLVGGWHRADGSDGITPDRRVLAYQTVRHVGEAICMVIAKTKAQALDACEAIEVDFDDLPVVIDTEEALADDAVRLVDGAADNISAQMHHGDAAASDAAFEAAAHVVGMDLTNQRLAPSSLEPRSVLAYPAQDGRLTVRISTQMPTGIRDTLANPVLGMEADDIRVLVGDVGGGFGMKTGMYPEDAAVAFAARENKVPVKWIAERGEELLTAAHGRDVVSHAELALDDQGKILAYRIRTDANVGAYANPTGVAIQLLIGPWVATSIYDIPVIDFQFRAILTNTGSTGAYRGAGRPEAIYITERLMDQAALKLGIAPDLIRRRNMVSSAQMPYTNPMQQVYDTGEFESLLDQVLELNQWNDFDTRLKQSASNDKLRGRGLASFLEWTGGMVFEERVTVKVSGDGMLEIMTALMPMGQGIATSFAQIVVDAFGVPLDNIRILHGDTDKANGFGSAGSRSIFAGGSAVRVASDRTIAKAKELAAQALECSADDIDYLDGELRITGTDKSIGLFELASQQADQHFLVDSTSSVDGSTWPNSSHVCEVEIDAQTGHCQVVQYDNVNDIGKLINPLIVTGQIEGGAVQGIGQALCEQIVYEKETGQLQTGSLMDYALPRADILGAFQTRFDQSVPCKNNPLGVKGVGELGTIGATPATVNAVMDALRRAGVAEDTLLGLQMPLTDEKIWAALNT